MPNLNLSPVHYGRWVRVVFDHPSTPPVTDPNVEFVTTWHSGVEFQLSDEARLVSHFSRMCREFVSLSKRFSLPQLDEGLWLLLSAEVELGKLLADETIPLSERLDCVRSMLVPFRDFVALSEEEELVNCFWMWWDLLATHFWSAHLWRLKEEELMEVMFDENMTRENHRDRLLDIEISFVDLNADGQAVLDTMLETLLAIAQSDDDRTVYYALHGLGHLRHPEGSAWLQRYVDDNRDELDEDGIKWLEQCRDETVM